MTNSTQKSNINKSLWLILLALVVIILLTIFCALPKIYQNIFDKTAAILTSDEVYAEVEFHTDKRQVYLTGFLADEKIEQLKNQIGDIFAVSKVEFTPKVLADEPVFDKVKFALLQDGKNLHLSGEVAAAQLVDLVNEKAAYFEVKNQLATNKNLPLWWDIDQLNYLLTLTKDFSKLEVAIDETLDQPSLKVTGDLLLSSQLGALAQEKITTALASLFPDTLAIGVLVNLPQSEQLDEVALYNLSQCQAKISQELAQAPVLFARAKSNLNTASKASLDTIAEIMKKCETQLVFAIGGHADSRGNDAINVPLSRARATEVVAYLQASAIAPERFTAKGYSANEPVADNASEEGRKLNRRIEIDVKTN